MTYIIGHRGAPFYEPENTIESFKKAVEFGVDFFECDVHLSGDGEIIVIHDETLDRTTNGKGYIKNFTLKELKNFRASGKYKIPTLKEVLKLNFPLIIELKSFKVSGRYEIYPNLVRKIIEMIKKSKFKKEIIFASFDRRYLAELENFSEFKKILLSKNFPNLNELKEIALFGLGIQYYALNSENVNLAHRQNLKILAWTVDKEEDIRKMLELELDFLASNDPKLALRIRREQK